MAIGDGQVMDRVRSFLLEPSFGNIEGQTPDDVARRRAMAQALWSQGQSDRPVVGVLDGMNRVLQSFLGGRGMRQAEGADAAIRQRDEQQQIAGLGQMADFAYPNQTTLQPATTRPVNAPTYNEGGADQWSAGDWPGGNTVSAPGTGIDSGVRILDEFEGFRATPYEDWSYRPGTGERYMSGMRIGYGQTIPGMDNITPEQAQGMLRQQIEQEYVPSIVGAIGAERWASLTPDQQGVLISLTHNYGSLPGRIIPALQSGDPAAAAQAIAALGADNSGINQRRREAEAAYFAGTGADRQVTTPNPTGEFVRGLIENPQTRPMAQALIEQEIVRLTTPPTPPEPYTLGANETRFDGNNQPVAQGGGTAPTPTDDMREYDLYRSQLPPGQTPLSFNDWDIARRRAGAPNYFENTWDRLTAEQQVNISNDIIGAEQTALNQIQNFDAMEALAADPNFYTGTGADFVANVRRLGIALGISDPDIAANTEAFSGLAAQAALDAMGGSLGAGFSNADRDFIERTMPNLRFSPEGNRTLIAIHRAIAQRNIEIAERLRQAGGRPTPEFMQELTRWALANPLFANGIPGTGIGAGVPSPAAPSAPAAAGPPPAGAGQVIYQNPEAGITIQRNN